MFVAGVDGCSAGWIAFKVELSSRITSVEVIDLPSLLTNRPSDLALIGIDIPIGLLDGSRACDQAARKLLGRPRGSSVFPAPCREVLPAKTHAEASAINQKKMGTKLSLQSFHIGPKIKQVDDAMTPDSQQWAFEVHPEVCFWALNGERPMVNKKKKKAGFNERLDLLSPIFLEIQRHLLNRPAGVAKDDLLDAAAAAWSALRRYRGEANCVCTSERDEKGLEVTICYECQYNSLMPPDPRAIHISTDGSCYKNPGGRSGCAAIVHYPDHLDREDDQIVDFGCEESSNNRMELLACICVLKWIRENKPWESVTRVQVFTDSRYVKENLFRAGEWKKNDWRNQHGEPRENSDLWKQLLSAQAKTGITVHFEWTLGKKSPVLKRVDKAAKAAATRGGPDIDRGYKPGAIARSMVAGAATRFPAKGQATVIRPYRKNLLGGGEEKVRFDIFSEGTQTYVESCYAFASTALAGELHRQHGYRVRFNDDLNYPKILEIVEEVPLPKPPAPPCSNPE